MQVGGGEGWICWWTHEAGQSQISSLLVLLTLQMKPTMGYLANPGGQQRNSSLNTIVPNKSGRVPALAVLTEYFEYTVQKYFDFVLRGCFKQYFSAGFSAVQKPSSHYCLINTQTTFDRVSARTLSEQVNLCIILALVPVSIFFLKPQNFRTMWDYEAKVANQLAIGFLCILWVLARVLRPVSVPIFDPGINTAVSLMRTTSVRLSVS